MILSVTMNPSVDILYQLDSFHLDTTNRANKTKKTAGGKGLNVARVIKLMNEDVIATGILGGAIGEFIEKELKKSNIPSEFLKTEHESRNCIAILHEGNQTEILEAGPTLSEREENDFLEKYKQLVKEADVVTISGSLPKGIDSSIYQKMITIADGEQTAILLDCSGDPLRNAILNKEKPYLIKPNETELSQLLNREITSNPVQLKETLTQDLFQGIPWIVVSMGADGAFVKVNDTFYTVKIPKVNAVNPVGSGDATIAGLAVAISKQQTVADTIKTAMTTGLLNALEAETGYIDFSKFPQYFDQITVEEFR